MIAITAASHEYMLSVAGPHLPVKLFDNGAFSVASHHAKGVTYIVRFVATNTGALAECGCGDYQYRSTRAGGLPCKHLVSVYNHLADKAIETAHAA